MLTVALDTSPLCSPHRFRGIGFYTKNLAESLGKIKNPDFKTILPKDTKSPLPETDLVHYPYFDLFYRSLPFRKKAKTVVTIHDVIPLLFPRQYPPGLRGRINLAFQKYSLKNASAVITDSEASKRDIAKYLGYPADKIHVVYLAPAPHFRQLEIRNLKLEIVRQKYFLPKRFVLYVGDANYHKNVISLIKACRAIRAPLVLVGKSLVSKSYDKSHPENRSLAEVQKEVRGDKNIHPLGFVPDKDLVAVYNLATVYCQPSFYEGFGLGVLEAMACGCPVVSADTGSLPEVCGRAAVMVDPHRVDHLAWGLKAVWVNEKLRGKLKTAGLKQARKFGWSKTAQATLKIYEKINTG